VLLYLKLPIFYIPQAAILKMAYLGIFCSGIAYITYMESLKLLTASKGSMVFFLKPVIASTLAIIFLGENLNIKTLIGMLLVLTGILINFVKINIKTRNSIEQ
jgi:drug/metabolite transporter (DMT)-like permease